MLEEGAVTACVEDSVSRALVVVVVVVVVMVMAV